MFYSNGFFIIIKIAALRRMAISADDMLSPPAVVFKINKAYIEESKSVTNIPVQNVVTLNDLYSGFFK